MKTKEIEFISLTPGGLEFHILPFKTVEQCMRKTPRMWTGKRDADGRMIYEGDKVEYRWLVPGEETYRIFKGHVYWDEDAAGFLVDKAEQLTFPEIEVIRIIERVWE